MLLPRSLPDPSEDASLGVPGRRGGSLELPRHGRRDRTQSRHRKERELSRTFLKSLNTEPWAGFGAPPFRVRASPPLRRERLAWAIEGEEIVRRRDG